MPTIIDNSGKKQSPAFLVGRVYKRDACADNGFPYLCVNTAHPGSPQTLMLVSLKNGSRWSDIVPKDTSGWTEVDCVINLSNKQQG